MTRTPTKTRPSGSKVKTGCLTCKIRRVKCDETKPVCERCTKTGRKCDGYDLLANLNQANSRGLCLTPGVSISIPGSAAEKRGFSYYLECTGSALSGYYDRSFWWQLMIQAATTDPVVRHGVIAMGALHETYASRLDHPSKAIEQGFAVVQYTKAISLLRRSLAQGVQDPQAALLSCILFASFESIRGHFASAIVHLRSGLDILRHTKVLPSENYIIPNYIAPALMRLTIQAVLHLKSTPKSEQKAFALKVEQFTKSPVNVDAFTTLEEARLSFNHIMCSPIYISLMFDYELPLSAQRDVAPVNNRLVEQLAKWSTAFEKYVRSSNSKLSDTELRGTVLLKIQHIAATITAHAISSAIEDLRPLVYTLGDRETFVPFIDDFAMLVKLASSLVAASKADFESGRSKSHSYFSVDWGLLWPLHYSYIKCPDKAIRAAALDVLQQCRRREGMWDSEAIVNLVQEASLITPADGSGSGQFTKQDGESLTRSFLPMLFDRHGIGGEWRWFEQGEGLHVVRICDEISR